MKRRDFLKQLGLVGVAGTATIPEVIWSRPEENIEYPDNPLPKKPSKDQLAEYVKKELGLDLEIKRVKLTTNEPVLCWARLLNEDRRVIIAEPLITSADLDHISMATDTGALIRDGIFIMVQNIKRDGFGFNLLDVEAE